MRSDELILLDACCLINLFASGKIEEILGTVPHRFAVARYVAENEVLSMYPGQDDEGRWVGERLSIAPLVASGLIEILDISSEAQQAAVVRFALKLDDGEAHTCALAVAHNGGVATDDRKALRVLSDSHSPGVPTRRTSELLMEWARIAGVDETEIAAVLHNVTRRGRFSPPRSDPHFSWWMRLCQQSAE